MRKKEFATHKIKRTSLWEKLWGNFKQNRILVTIGMVVVLLIGVSNTLDSLDKIVSTVKKYCTPSSKIVPLKIQEKLINREVDKKKGRPLQGPEATNVRKGEKNTDEGTPDKPCQCRLFISTRNGKTVRDIIVDGKPISYKLITDQMYEITLKNGFNGDVGIVFNSDTCTQPVQVTFNCLKYPITFNCNN